MRSSRSAPRHRGSSDRAATARAKARCATMRSSLAVPSKFTLPGGNLFRAVERVNSELTHISTGCRSGTPDTLHAVLALQFAAVLMWLVAGGFGIPAPFVASH